MHTPVRCRMHTSAAEGLRNDHSAHRMKPLRSHMSPSQVLRRSAALAVCALGVTAAVASADPVAPGPATSLPAHTGSAAKAHPMPATIAPRHPFMAKNPFSNIHNDPWMTDAYQNAGPLGRNLQATSVAHTPGICGSLAFDSKGNIVSVCAQVGAGPQARVFDAKTHALIATYEMPNAPSPAGTPFYQAFTGGGYFFVDGQDHIWTATKTNHLMGLAIREGGHRLVKIADYDLTAALP